MDKDLKAIEELHRKDQTASLNRDTETLISLFAEDGILIQADGRIIQGHKQLKEMLVEGEKQFEEYEILEYVHEFAEINVMGEYAYEWGSYYGKYRSRLDNSELSGSGKLMRILKRQADNSWKIHRSIWNVQE